MAGRYRGTFLGKGVTRRPTVRYAFPMNKRTVIAALLAVLALSGCKAGDPCDAQPNPDKQAVCSATK